MRKDRKMERNQYIIDIFYELLNRCYERNDYRMIITLVSTLERYAVLNELNIPINKMKQEILKTKTMQSAHS